MVLAAHRNMQILHAASTDKQTHKLKQHMHMSNIHALAYRLHKPSMQGESIFLTICSFNDMQHVTTSGFTITLISTLHLCLNFNVTNILRVVKYT